VSGSFYKAISITLGIVALVCGFLFARMSWAPKIDFDIIGFLWVVGNIPRLTMLVVCFVAGTAAVWYWMKGRLEDG
jgi:hypothetical protein